MMDSANAKKATFIVLLSTVSFCFALASLVFKIDPLHFFRKNDKEFIIDNPYYLNATIPKTYEFGGIVIGSSMIQTIQPVELEKRFGFPFIKLTSGAESLDMQAYVLDSALRDDTKIAIWAIDFFPSFIGKKKKNQYEDFPFYLYSSDRNYFKVLTRYLLEFSFIKPEIQAWLFHEKKERTDFNRLYDWNDSYTFSCKRVLQYIDFLEKSREIDFSRLNLESERFTDKELEEALLPIKEVIAKKPNTRFVLFFPPYSIVELFLRLNRAPSFLNLQFKLRNRVRNLLKDYNNVELYDFQGQVHIIKNLELYKDSHHYNRKVNEMILDRIQNRYEANVLTDETEILKLIPASLDTICNK